MTQSRTHMGVAGDGRRVVRPARAALAVVAVVLSGWVTGCGIQPEAQPRLIPPGAQVPVSTPSTAPSPSDEAPVAASIWLVNAGRIVSQDRDLASTPSSQELLDLLAAGPTEAEADSGNRTAVVSVVTGEPVVVTATATGLQVPDVPGRAWVVIRDEFYELPGEEQLLVLGQVVTTLATGDVVEVAFLNETGDVPAVPLPDGKVTDGPVTPRDYAGLRRG